MPSFGTIGDCYDNAMMEPFWSSMQIERLNRKKWRTRLDYHSPVEHEPRFSQTPISA